MAEPTQMSLFAAQVPAQLLTIPEAARVLGIGRSTVYELIGAGGLETVHIGRSVRVPLAGLIEFVDGLRVANRGRRGDAL